MTKVSSNGWTASPSRPAIGVKNFIVPGTTRHLACASAVAPLLIAFAQWFHEHVEPIDEGTYDDWGYNYREIVGFTTLSDHSSGTAIDLNASKHPQHKAGTFPPEKAAAIRQACVKYGLKWGGDYKGERVDEMHYSINLNPLQVQARIKELKLPKPKEKK